MTKKACLMAKNDEKSIKVLFFHGGPGLNSNPERNLLAKTFAQEGLNLITWNEPSLLRGAEWPADPALAYSYFLSCAEQFLLEQDDGAPLFILAHSFGAHAACHLVKKFPEKVAKVFFISTDLDLATTDLNMFRIVMEDFKLHQDDRYLQLQQVIQNYSGAFDQNAEDGFNLFVQNPNWFNYYWHNNQHKNAFAQCLQEPGFTVDLESFFKIRRSFVQTDGVQSPIPAVALFGKYDIIVSSSHELSILKKRFKSLKIQLLEDSAHYPHVEQTDEVLAILLKEVVPCAKSITA